MNCPRCQLEMDHIEAEPDVGLLSTVWFCEACETSFDEEGNEI